MFDVDTVQSVYW